MQVDWLLFTAKSKKALIIEAEVFFLKFYSGGWGGVGREE